MLEWNLWCIHEDGELHGLLAILHVYNVGMQVTMWRGTFTIKVPQKKPVTSQD
jgi:hypothetical protein